MKDLIHLVATNRRAMLQFLATVVMLIHCSVLVGAQTCSSDGADNNNSGECMADKEGLTEDDREAMLGLNAFPARLAVVSGQAPNLEMCGEWCHTVSDPGTPCRMDTDYVPCQGDYHCTTTCRLWEKNILMDPLNGFQAGKRVTERPVTSCAMFKRFDGFVSTKTSETCDTSCLLPEIRPHRYPAPTGLGLGCQKGTCYAVSSSYAEGAPAKLECPCNWFGSDCQNDEFPIVSIQHTAVYGDMPGAVTATTIQVGEDAWYKIMENHQPGGVIRITHRNEKNGRNHEQPYAIAAASAQHHTIEVLTAQPDQSLDIVPRDVAERIRSYPLDNMVISNPPNLFVNPSIAGFFNSQWQFLLPAIDERKIQHLVLLSTGAGLSGSLSVLAKVLPTIGNKSQSPLKSVHLYHGVRTLEELPYQEKLHDLATNNLGMQLIVVQSQGEDRTDTSDKPKTIRQAVMRGDLARQLVAGKNDKKSVKVYVHHILESDLTNSGVSLADTVFVACGRLALLEDSKAMLQNLYCKGGGSECLAELGEHFFTNI